MRRDFRILAGVSAAALLAVLAQQAGLFGSPDPVPTPALAESDDDPGAGTAASLPSGSGDSAPPSAPEALRREVAGLASEIDRLTAELERREAELERSAARDEARDAEMVALRETLAGRDAETAELRAQIDRLEGELAALRERLAFDLVLASAKLDAEFAEASGPDMAAVETALAAAKPGVAEIVVEASAEGAAAVERALTDIQFEFGSAELTPGGRTRAAVAAAMLAEMEPAAIRLLGFTDRAGNPAANRALAERRARAVAAFLVSTGLPEALMEVNGMGETGAPVTTRDGVREPLNRRVTILAVGARSG